MKRLLGGELEVTGRLIDASNATLYATLTFEGARSACIYKPIQGERPLWDFPDGNLASREYAAYLVSEALAISVVPPTVLRDGPFGPGMVQQWIEVDESIDLALFYATQDPQLRQMALFDAVINNTDRKIGHLLPDSEGKLYGCDHGVTFHSEDKLRTVLWQWAGEEFTSNERTSLEILASWVINTSELTSLLTVMEISALSTRIRQLLRANSFPLPNPDWPSIPWPAF